MNKYKITTLGKIILTLLLILILSSFFINKNSFIVLIVFVILIFTLQFFSMKRQKHAIEENKLTNVKETIVEHEVKEEKIEKEVEKIIKKNYEGSIENIDLIDKDILEIQNDLEELSLNVDNTEINDIKDYFGNMKDNMVNRKEDITFFEEEEKSSIFDNIIEFFKGILKFHKYPIDDFVIHNQFGIGKIIDNENVLTVSFVNDNYFEEIQFEYNSNKKVPEINLFKIPKDEDSRRYYFDYKNDISNEFKLVIEKINDEFENVNVFENIFIKNEKAWQCYDLILISDKINIFGFKKNMDISAFTKLLKNHNIEAKVENHQINSYEEIKRVLLKEKVLMDENSKEFLITDEIRNELSKVIDNTNIKDFNERELIIRNSNSN